MTVVLPAPLEPSRAKMLPRVDVEVDAAEHLQVLERLDQALDPDGRVGGHRGSLPSAASTAAVSRARSLSIQRVPA